jgi:hypothetical protein
MAAAEQVGPDGEVVISDVAAEMTAIAARRAAARGIGNVTARELDLEGIAAPDEEVSVPLRVPSFDALWSRTTALAGPLAKMLAVQPQETIEAIRHRAREAVRSYETADGLELPGISLLASGRRP